MTVPVLVTGFEPFGGDPVNPSLAVLLALQAGEPLPGVRLHTQPLPCVFGRALQVLDEALRRTRPALVIALGLAASRDAVSVERVAINVDDARIPDNEGALPVDRPVVPGGPAAYFSTLPIKAIVAALRDEGLPAEVSQTAGTFVCNHVFYGLMHRLRGQPGVRAGFVHLPCLPQQTQALQGRPGLPLADQERAVRHIVQVALQAGDDLRVAGGAID